MPRSNPRSVDSEQIAAEQPRSLEAINKRSQYAFFEFIKYLFETIKIEYWAKTVLPGPPNRALRFAQKAEKVTKAHATFRAGVSTSIKVGKAAIKGDAGDPKDHTLAGTVADLCVEAIVAGVEKVFNNKTSSALLDAGSHTVGADLHQGGKIEDAWKEPLKAALEKLFDEMFESIPNGVNVAAANLKTGKKLTSNVINFGTAVLNRYRISEADVNSILHGGPELVANSVTKLLNRQIASAAADIAMDALKASLTIASFGTAHAAVELGSKAAECLMKIGKMIHEVIIYKDFQAARPVLASMKLTNGAVSAQDEEDLRKSIAKSPLCAALIMGHSYMSYYSFLLVTQVNEDPVHPNVFEMTTEQQKTLAAFQALKTTARTYCKGIPHGLSHADGAVQVFLEALMRGSSKVTTADHGDYTALQSVMFIENDMRRFIARIDRAIEQWKGTAVADDATAKTASQGFGDVLFANPFKPEKRARKRDMIANVFKKAKHHFGHHPEKLFIQFISERCQRREFGRGSVLEQRRKVFRYLGAIAVAIPELRLERWLWQSGHFETMNKKTNTKETNVYYVHFSLGRKVASLTQNRVPNYVDPNAKLLKLGQDSSLRQALTEIVNEEKYKL